MSFRACMVWGCLCVLLLSACVAAPPVRPSVALGEPGLDLTLRVARLGQPERRGGNATGGSWTDPTEVEVVVLLRATTPLPNPLDFASPNRWAGFDDLALDLGTVRAFSAEGHELRVEQTAGRVRVIHEGTQAVRLEYDVIPRGTAFTRNNRFHAVGTDHLFFAYGRNLFLLPILESAPTVTLHFEFARDLTARHLQGQAPQDAVWLSTLVASPVTTIRDIPVMDMLDAAYLAGFPAVFPTANGGLVALDRSLVDGGAETLLTLVETLDANLHATLGPPPYGAAVAFVLNRVDEPDEATGSGRPGGVVLELGEDALRDAPRLAQLAGHELLHRYIGMQLQLAERDALETLWFKEGVVEYLAADAVVRTGLSPPESFFAMLANAVTGYRRSVEILDTPTVATYWRDAAQRRFPYDVGFLVGFWLDQQLRGQGSSLAEWLQDVLESSGGDPLGSADLRRALSGNIPEDEVELLFEYYLSRRLRLPVERWLVEAGLRLDEHRRDAPYFGLTLNVTQRGTWEIAGVDPLGPAARSGLRAGDTLLDAPRIPSAGMASVELSVRRGARAEIVIVDPTPGERVELGVSDPSGDFGDRLDW